MIYAWGINGERHLRVGDSVACDSFVIAVGETADDQEREEEDILLCHLPRHCHHLRGLVFVRVD